MKGYICLSSYIFYALTSLDSPSPSFKTVVYFGVSSSSQGSYYGLRKEHSLLSALKLSRVFWDSRVLVGCLLRTAQFASPNAHNFGLESQHKAKSASLTQFRKVLGKSSTCEHVNILECFIQFQHM